ncbi:MAG: EF-hand domain-containing protein [Gammaproteobacteria bacterium]|nr:EF-hand domain-containing protein [Gammaproteobacteria bacterium]
MKTLKLALLTTATLGLVAATVSWSHGPDTQGGDRRGHGKFPVSIAAAEAKAQEAFARIDGDSNAEISRAEFDAADLPRHRGPGMRRHAMHGGHKHDADADAAHAASGDENQAEFFAALDSDGDGQLSPAEFDRDHRRKVRKSLMKSRAFDHLDADANGVLSASEFPGRRLQHLKSLDADNNGEVSRDELRDGMRARHQHSG